MQNEMRDRLIDILGELDCDNSPAYIADHLIKNGVVALDTNIVSPKNRPLIQTVAEMPIDEVLDLVKAKQEGRIIVPPCKVGDTVWFNTFKKNATVCVGIQPHTVDRIDVICVCDTKNLVETNIRDWEFGKTVFLTKEEAEKVLKEGADNA